MTDTFDHITELYELACAQCDGQLTAEQTARLEDLVVGQSALRRHYILYMHIHAAAEQGSGRAEGIVARGQWSVASDPDSTSRSFLATNHSLLVTNSNPQSPIPNLFFLDTSFTHPSPTIHYPLSTFHSFVATPLFSYLVAALIVGLGLLIASAWKISKMPEIAHQSLPPAGQRVREPEPMIEFVGQITGTVDCKWADPNTATMNGVKVRLGRKYALASGLMEITYNTGAKVILQGPCTYVVESPTGGFLSLGKLTARVEKNEELRTKNEEVTASSSSLLVPRSYFAVRTPTAIVTDLGTEFGVEVDPLLGSHVETFVGAVMVMPAVNGKSTGSARLLSAGKSLRIDAAGSVATPSIRAVSFVRSIRQEEVSPYTKAILSDYPVGYWPLDDKPGATSIADHSGHGHRGYARGPLKFGQSGPLADASSRSIAFDGDSYIEFNQLPNSDPAKGFSIEAWANAKYGEGPQSIMVNEDNIGGYMLYAWPDRWDFSTRNGAATAVWDTMIRPIVHKQWTHLVGTFEPTGEKAGDAVLGVKRLYINGDLVATEKGRRFVPQQWNRLYIGAGATSLPDAMFFFNGWLAEVAIYDRPLSADQVKAHYEVGTGLHKVIEHARTPARNGEPALRSNSHERRVSP